MKHVDGVMPLYDINNAPLAQDMNPDLLDPGTNRMDWFPIIRIEPILNVAQLEAGVPTSFVREVPEVIQARSHESEQLRHHAYII
jgi:hypothetical protein